MSIVRYRAVRIDHDVSGPITYADGRVVSYAYDLNDRLGLSLESQDYDSIGGLVIGLLEHLPEEGESVDHGNLRLLVEHVEKNRIEKVRIEIHKEQEEEETEKDEEK